MVRPSLKVAQGFKRYCDFCFREVQKFVSVTWASLLLLWHVLFYTAIFSKKWKMCLPWWIIWYNLVSYWCVIFCVLLFKEIIKLRGVDVCGCNFDTRAALLWCTHRDLSGLENGFHVGFFCSVIFPFLFFFRLCENRVATGRVEGVSRSPLSSPSTDLSVFADLPNLSGTTLLNKKIL